MEIINQIFSPEAFSTIGEYCFQLCKNLVVAALVFIIGKWFVKHLVKLIEKLLKKKKVDISLHSFLMSITEVTLYFVLAIIIISILGIETSSFIALFASAGMAIGMALSGTLQNFAGGVMILIFKPFRVGDFIEAQGYSGTVKEIQIFNTVLQTPDNKIILVPNGAMSTGIVNNYSREAMRRVDFSFSLSYGDDYEKAKEVIKEIIAADKRIVENPEPFVALGSLGTSSIDITVRVWVRQEDYWGVFFDMNEKVYATLPKRGFNFPYQTITVNMKK